MEGRQRRSFTDDYKRKAVDLVASRGRSIGSVAKELGLRDSVLRRWVEQRGARLEPTAAARRPATQATLPSERALRASGPLPSVSSSTTSSGFIATQTAATEARASMLN
ncbi:transposase-like protein [Bradyrhizobium sp. USDA 4486]